MTNDDDFSLGENPPIPPSVVAQLHQQYSDCLWSSLNNAGI